MNSYPFTSSSVLALINPSYAVARSRSESTFFTALALNPSFSPFLNFVLTDLQSLRDCQ